MQQHLPRSLSRSLLAALMLSLAQGPALAADGTCASGYSTLLPDTAGYAYISDAAGYALPSKRAVPLIYRDGFTSDERKEAIQVPAGYNSYNYFIHFSPYVNVSGPPPHYSGTHNDVANPLGFAATAGQDLKKNVEYLWMPDESAAGTDRFVVNHLLPPYYAAYSANYSPDIDAPDSEVLQAANKNSARLTPATLERLAGYASSKKMLRPYADFKSPVTTKAIRYNFHYSGSWWTEWSTTASVDCAFFNEMVKHPRLPDVYMLKSFTQTSGKISLASSTPYKDWLITYTPVVLAVTKDATLSPDSLTIKANENGYVSPLGNDTPGSAGPLTLKSVSPPQQGSISVSGNTVTYTPPLNWSGVASMTYTATDGTKDYSSSIVVTVENMEPTLTPDHVLTGHTNPVTLNALDNDVDPDGPNPLKLTSVEKPAHGSLTWTPDGRVAYVPEHGFIGIVTVDYTATDGTNSGSSYIAFSTIQCFEDVWQSPDLQCAGRGLQGSADFVATCGYNPPAHAQVEVACPVY